MYKLLTFLVIFSALSICTSVKIKTKLGELEGAERKSRDGKTYYAFTGVPYAQPPLGKLRLKNPVAVKPWNKVLDATKESPKCLQVQMFVHSLRNITFGQEDCLYLSVYTPDLKPKEKLAVMVQFHGGGFRCGDAGPKDNADYLMDGGVILVNVHYRLGVLGFLSTENQLIPGNFGLKDQSLALHWVKDNIERFGGDSDKITIFGESAGGASTHYHMISPMSKSIIKGAISQSGVVNTVWGFNEVSGASRDLANQVANIVGCDGKTGTDLLDCLQNTDAELLIRSELEFLYWDFEPAVVFRPVQEPLADGAFLPFNPLKQETTVPWMTGVVSAEGIFKIISLKTQGDSLTQQFIDNMDEYILKLMSLNPKCPKAKDTIKMIKDRYFPEPNTIKSTMDGIDLFFRDVNFIYPLAEAMRKHKGPLYQYYYDYRAGSSLVDLYGENDDEVTGVCHGDDLLVLFNMKEIFPKTKPTDEQVSRTMVKLWTNFAKHQKPTTEEDEVQWTEHDSTGKYFHITTELSVKRHLYADVIDWWYQLPIFKDKSSGAKTEL